MSHAQAIIGGNWGDEGKGLGVDALTHKMREDGCDVVVVRSNGGAQAGHGVERPDGSRHVFHHIGAGTLAGATTHLSQHFASHPMVLEDEILKLETLGQDVPQITVDPRSPVTTPWDMAVNQTLEMARAGGRHGSTGLGFGETIERHENGPRLIAQDLWSVDLEERLEVIRREWVPKRLKELGITLKGSPMADVLSGKIELATRFMHDCDYFRRRACLMSDADILSRGSVLFEGAQGLQLDMDYGAFPHVTRSYTGLRNMLNIAQEAGISEIAPIYMTRAYATRHGAGPFPHEVPGPNGLGQISFADVTDLTNAPNEWQGTIRHAALDADLLGKTISRDAGLAEGYDIAVRPTLGVTCLDQLTAQASIVSGGVEHAIDPDILADFLSDVTQLPLMITSWGPCREDVAIGPASAGELAA